MLTIIIAFICGVTVGVVLMAFVSASSSDKSEVEKTQLRAQIKQQENLIRRYEELISEKKSDLAAEESGQSFNLDTDEEQSLS